MLAYTFKTYSAPTGPNKKLSHVWPDNFWAISLVLQLTADSNPPTSYHHIITRLHQGWTNKGLNRGTELCLHFISSAFLFLFLCLLFTLFMLLFAIECLLYVSRQTIGVLPCLLTKESSLQFLVLWIFQGGNILFFQKL